VTTMSALIVLLALVGVVWLFKDRLVADSSSRSTNQFPYIKKGPFFTTGEGSFFRVLKSTLGDDFEIFGQVRVADLLEVKRGLSNSGRQKHINKIRSKHVDFVLCDPGTLNIICAIELDDKSHKRKDRVARDEFLDAAFKSAGLPLVRFKAKYTYAHNEVVEHLSRHIDMPKKATAIVQEPRTQSEDMKCPKCSSNMQRKHVTTGKRSAEVWCCSKFPACETVIPAKALTE